MSATCNVQEANGTGTYSTVTAARFCTTDSYNPAATYPIPVPTSGTNLSYWKTWRLAFTGTYTQITNVKIYSDGGGFGTGITTYIGSETGAAYVAATGTAGTTGVTMVTNYTGITATEDLFTYTSGTPKTIDSTTLSGNPSYCNTIVCQMAVTSAATQGDLADETITFTYDEI